MINSQHPSSAKTRISLVPDSENPVVHPQPSISDSEYKIRLLSLYIAQVQQTGRTDYPELVQFLDQVYAVENASEGAEILPNHYDILLQNLQLAQADILMASKEIQILLNILADELAQKNLKDELEEQVRSGIRQEIQRFLKAAEYLLDTAQQHAIQTQFRFWKSRSSPEEIEAEDLRKRINDLKYIREYLAEHLRIRELIQEFVPAEGKIGNFHRLHKYLELAPSAADFLGNCLQQTLQRKIAGDRKFVTPKSYR
ncbi:hypothetical protein QUB63_21835 [Microcoleus sp. ARI1-B5]|uniref:hypothetical protein n=1 Tax=unclassified Microcoleus TaxID=2642155 RepID=UPI002FD11EC4